MSIIVFVGPTVPVETCRQVLDATYLPPVSQGDVYRAALDRPRAIGIIDGFFERVPAVWHKEILWAMARGIHVFGAASMGAAVAVKELIATGKLKGTVRFYGTPAEESVGGKVYMIEVNDNPNVDAGFEDAVLGEELYLRVMRVFLARVAARHRSWGGA